MATLVALLAAGICVAALPAGQFGREPKIRAVRANADAYVTAANPRANFGRSRRLRIANKPLARTFLLFSLNNTQGEIRRVSLLVFSRTVSRKGYSVHLAGNGWNERRLRYDNAPRIFSRSIASGPLRARAWKAVDITSLVGRGSNEKKISLGLTAKGTGTIELASRESGLTGPRLVIETLVDDNGSTKSFTVSPPPPPPAP